MLTNIRSTPRVQKVDTDVSSSTPPSHPVKYSPDNRIFFSDLRVDYYLLSGYLDGTYVEFVPYDFP